MNASWPKKPDFRDNEGLYLTNLQFDELPRAILSISFKTFTLFRYHIIVISSVLLLLFAFVFLFCIIYDPREKIIDYH